MSITNILRKVTGEQPARPAAAALQALKARIITLQQQNQEWGDRAQSAVKDIREHDDAVKELEHFNDRYLSALADREVHGETTSDPALIKIRVDEARARADRLADRRRVAEAVLAKVRAEQQRTRTEMTSCAEQLPAQQHAAVMEHLHAIAPEFIAAEQAYMAAQAKVFGAARLADHLARQQLAAGKAHLGWAGGVNVGDLFYPRPQGSEFNPIPQRPAIEAAIRAAAEALEKELT